MRKEKKDTDLSVASQHESCIVDVAMWIGE
jgi:hypothetical protein